MGYTQIIYLNIKIVKKNRPKKFDPLTPLIHITPCPNDFQIEHSTVNMDQFTVPKFQIDSIWTVKVFEFILLLHLL